MKRLEWLPSKQVRESRLIERELSIVANETRLAMLYLLKDGDCRLEGIASELGVEESKARFHLALLKINGFVNYSGQTCSITEKGRKFTRPELYEDLEEKLEKLYG